MRLRDDCTELTLSFFLNFLFPATVNLFISSPNHLDGQEKYYIHGKPVLSFGFLDPDPHIFADPGPRGNISTKQKSYSQNPNLN